MSAYMLTISAAVIRDMATKAKSHARQFHQPAKKPTGRP